MSGRRNCISGKIFAFTVASASADGPEPAFCSTCQGPKWSWDRFPAFWHCSDDNGPNGGFTEEALDTIARFPMATLEKWQGDQVDPPISQEEAWIVAAKQLKERNPDITVIVWYDSLRIYTADKSLNPDLNKHCTTGHFRAAEFLETHPEYLLKNKSGLPALESYGNCHIHDFTKVASQNFWREMCLNMTASGVIDGCGADASWQNGVDQDWDLDDATAAAWGKGHREMMRSTTEALGDGVLLGKNSWEVGDYVNGALHEGCDAANTTVNTLRNLTQVALQQKRRLIYQCHSKTGTLDEVAAFLVGAGPYHYFGLGQWHGTGKDGNFSEHWMPGVFDRALGAPLDDAVYDPSTDDWTRSFASGTVVTFNAKTNAGTISWGSDLQGDEVVV